MSDYEVQLDEQLDELLDTAPPEDAHAERTALVTHGVSQAVTIIDRSKAKIELRRQLAARIATLARRWHVDDDVMAAVEALEEKLRGNG